MRPRLLDDVRYVECEEGVYIENGLGSCILKGRHAYRWVDALAPRLSGDRGLEEITQGLPDAHRDMVEGLVRTLAEQRFVVDARDDREHGLSERELTEYASEIAFIRYGYDSAEWRFQQVRNARILLYGQGPVLDAIAVDGLRSGWRRLRVLASDADAALDETARRALRDEEQQVNVETAGSDPAADPLLRAHIGDADLVVHVASGDATEDLSTVARMCADADVALTQVLVRDTDAWATPVHGRDQAFAESGWRWLAADAAEPPETGVSWLTGPVPSLIAAGVALACFRHLAGMRPERPGVPSGERISGTMTRIDLVSLDTTAHRFHRHPATAAPAAWDAEATRDRIDALRSAERVPPEELLERAIRFTNPHLGPLRALDEDDLPQVPLALSRATVTDPYGRRPPSQVEPVFGWSGDHATARVRAVLSALSAYGSLVAEHEVRQATAWGMDPLTGDLRQVRLPDAALRRAYRAPLGAAAGLSWSEAVRAGLLAHLEALPVLLRDGAPHVDPVRESGGDDDVRGLMRLLDRTGEVFEFRDHSAAVGLPSYTVATGRGVVARSVASTPARALCHAAEHALLAWQTHVEGRPEAVPPVRRWAASEPATPDTRPDARPDARPQTEQEATSGTNALARRLRDLTGRTPVIVPLVRDDVVNTLLPFVVQVVLCDD